MSKREPIEGENVNQSVAARMCGVETVTLKKWRSIPGKGPQGFFHRSDTCVLYPRAEVEKWLADRAAAPKPAGIGLPRSQREGARA